MGELFTGYNSNMKDRAKNLRKNMTPQEKHLWYNFLRDYPVKVYRQRSIDQFIVDFYCSQAHLVIEIDGTQHLTPKGKSYDTERSKILAHYNLEVIRINNYDIDHNFPAVCQFIDQKIKEGLTTWHN